MVIDKRISLEENVCCELNKSIRENKCGLQLFHTNNKKLWDFVNNIVEFNINKLVTENVVEAKY